jgi:hypothetical protein
LSISQTNNDYDLLLEVNKNIPKYGFSLEEIKNKFTDKSYLIKIYNSKTNLLIQTIDLSRYDFWYKEHDYPYIDSLVDINFDGYRDLCVVTDIGQNGKNWGYDIFTFNETDKIFCRNENFPTLYNFYTEDSLRQIYESIWSCGGDECIQWNTYTVKDDKPFLIERDYQEFDRESNKLRRYIELYQNDELISKEEVKPRED